MILKKIGTISDGRTMDYFFKDNGTDGTTSKLGKELLSALLKSAGRGKDEIVQIIGREMGFALAAVLKEPLEQLVKNKKLQISLELVDKSNSPAPKAAKKKASKAKKKRI